jgi:hypothetical protein
LRIDSDPKSNLFQKYPAHLPLHEERRRSTGRIHVGTPASTRATHKHTHTFQDLLHSLQQWYDVVVEGSKENERGFQQKHHHLPSGCESSNTQQQKGNAVNIRRYLLYQRRRDSDDEEEKTRRKESGSVEQDVHTPDVLAHSATTMMMIQLEPVTQVLLSFFSAGSSKKWAGPEENVL